MVIEVVQPSAGRFAKGLISLPLRGLDLNLSPVVPRIFLVTSTIAFQTEDPEFYSRSRLSPVEKNHGLRPELGIHRQLADANTNETE